MRSVSLATAIVIAFLMQSVRASTPEAPDVIFHPHFGVARSEFVKTHSRTFSFVTGKWEVADPRSLNDPICEKLSVPTGFLTYEFLHGVLEEVEYDQDLGPGNSKQLTSELTTRFGSPSSIYTRPEGTIDYRWKQPDRFILLSLEKSVFGYHYPTVLVASPAYVKSCHLESLFGSGK